LKQKKIETLHNENGRIHGGREKKAMPIFTLLDFFYLCISNPSAVNTFKDIILQKLNA